MKFIAFYIEITYHMIINLNEQNIEKHFQKDMGNIQK